MNDRLQSKGYVKRPAGNSGWSWRVNGRTDKRPTGGGGHCRDMKSPSVSLSWDEALTSQLRHQEAGASQHHMTAAYAPLKAHGISYKKATLSSTTTITPTNATISLLIMGPNTVNPSPSKARVGEHYYLYSNRIYEDLRDLFFLAQQVPKAIQYWLEQSVVQRTSTTYLRLPVSRLQLYSTTYILPFTKMNLRRLCN